MRCLSVMFAVLLGTCSGQTALVVLPNELAHVEGNSEAIAPFTAPIVGGTNPPSVLEYYSMRYQQIYDASQFAALAPEGELILAVGIRIDSDAGQSFDAVLHNMQVNLSTTQKSADGLSTNFMENVGPDEIVAFRGQWAFGWGYSVGSRPQPFHASIPSGWFFYRPSAGNLLLDIRVFTYSNSFPATAFDASNVEGDGTSIVYSTNASSAIGVRSTMGLVTQFQTFPTPELSLSRTNDDLRFNWLDYPRGYLLETRDCLDCAWAWQPVAERGTTNGYDREILLPLETDAPPRYYRLSWTPPAKALPADQHAEEGVFSPPKNH